MGTNERQKSLYSYIDTNVSFTEISPSTLERHPGHRDPNSHWQQDSLTPKLSSDITFILGTIRKNSKTKKLFVLMCGRQIVFLVRQF